MSILIKKFIFTLTINIIFFIVLMIGIQNSNDKYKVNLLISKTIEFPTSFIIGTSFIFGFLSGSLPSLVGSNKE